jgi:hypothetical protein
VAGIWPNEAGPAAAAQLAEALRAAAGAAGGHLTVYERHEIPARLHFTDSERVAPVVAIAEEGWSIRVDGGTNVSRFSGGAHGYGRVEEGRWKRAVGREPLEESPLAARVGMVRSRRSGAPADR